MTQALGNAYLKYCRNYSTIAALIGRLPAQRFAPLQEILSVRFDPKRLKLVETPLDKLVELAIEMSDLTAVILAMVEDESLQIKDALSKGVVIQHLQSLEDLVYRTLPSRPDKATLSRMAADFFPSLVRKVESMLFIDGQFNDNNAEVLRAAGMEVGYDSKMRVLSIITSVGTLTLEVADEERKREAGDGSKRTVH